MVCMCALRVASFALVCHGNAARAWCGDGYLLFLDKQRLAKRSWLLVASILLLPSCNVCVRQAAHWLF